MDAIENKKNQRPSPPVVIAGYFDILGFQNLIELSEKNWEAAVEKVKLIDSKLRENFTQPDGGGVVRFFSDNVYVSVPVKTGSIIKPDNLFWFFRKLYELQWFFVEAGIFIRGGVAVGTQYVTETTLFGTALARAYAAESKLANVPRVVVDQSFVTALDVYQKKMKGYGASNTRLLIRKDNDGVNFVDYMSLWDDWDWTEDFRRKIFQKHRTGILKQVRATTDPHIIQKYLWVARYHNRYATRYGCAIDIDKEFGPKLPAQAVNPDS